MNELVFLLEEKSAQRFLEGYLPRILPDGISCRYVTFDGKKDLLKNISIKLKAWCAPVPGFIILIDKDHGDCLVLKEKIRKICADAGKPHALIRIACVCLENWYLGNLADVATCFDIKIRNMDAAKYRTPDNLANAVEEMRRITNDQYYKVKGSKALGRIFSTEYHNNKSHSFRVFVSGVLRMAGQTT